MGHCQSLSIPFPEAIETSLRSRQSLDWSVVFHSISDSVQCALDEISAKTQINQRDLRLRLLLHLPRFSPSQLACYELVREEARRLAVRLLSRLQDYRSWTGRSPIHQLIRSQMFLQPCSSDMARQIHERFHYIGSYHEGVAHLGLFVRETEDVPMILATLSPMDILHLDGLFPSDEDKRRVLILSRVFAFDWAPKNAISFLLGRVYKWVRENLPHVHLLLSYVNPNLGFTGSSYLASNWKPFIEIAPVYSYLEGNYVTYRTLVSLSTDVRRNVEYSPYKFKPLKLFKYDLQR